MDLDSKFGTFKRLNEPIRVEKDGNIVPIQIEKKCFFFKQEQRYTQCNKFCSSLFGGQGGKRDSELYDYFLCTFDKYPLSCRNYLAPFLAEVQRALQEQIALKH